MSSSYSSLCYWFIHCPRSSVRLLLAVLCFSPKAGVITTLSPLSLSLSLSLTLSFSPFSLSLSFSLFCTVGTHLLFCSYEQIVNVISHFVFLGKNIKEIPHPSLLLISFINPHFNWFPLLLLRRPDLRPIWYWFKCVFCLKVSMTHTFLFLSLQGTSHRRAMRRRGQNSWHHLSFKLLQVCDFIYF